jgi:outer membrane protein OmpA-like peptidoglycan-associated protein
MRTRIALLTTALVLGFGGVALAQAQPPGFYTERFEPMPDQGINLLNLSSSQVLGHLLPSAGLFFQYLDDPLQVVTGDDTQVLSRVIEHQVKADLWLSFGFANVVELSVVMPFVLNQSGSDEQVFNRKLDSFVLGDLRLIPKVKIIDAADAGGFGLAVLLNLSLPTGSQDNFTSDGAVRLEPKIALDWTDRDSGFSVVGNVGYHLRPTTEVNNLVVDDAITWGVGVRVPTPLDELKVLASVFGAIPLDKNVDPSDPTQTVSDLRSTPIELDVAAELTLGDFVGTAGAGFGLTEGFGSPDYRLFLSFGYVPRCQDPDGDGLCSRIDECPEAPEDFDGFEDGDGCPDLDNDKDGVPDVSDGAPDSTGFGRCRDNPEDKDGFEDADGCPDKDNDQDGIPDVRDGAADANFPGFGVCRGVDADKPEFTATAEDKDGYQDEDGCPEPDNDGDGVLDVDDGAKDATGYGQCRDNPEDKDGFEDEDGCPDLDNDGDGELDVNDGPAIDSAYPGFGICRDAPGMNEADLKAKGFEPPWKWQDAKKPYPGCPMVIASCQCGQIIITQMVQFRYNSAALSPDSHPLLDAVAQVLIEKKCASKIRVEGHTDWHGATKYNDSLSQRRVDSVVKYLIKKGIAKERLQAKGYGERKPLDPNDHKKVCDRCSPGCTCEPGSKKEPNPNEAEIRRLNRRVQFNIMELTDDVRGTVDQCPVDY